MKPRSAALLVAAAALALLLTTAPATAMGSPQRHLPQARTTGDCASHTSQDGTLTVCPGKAPVGATVTLTASTGCHLTRNPSIAAVFLGPRAWIGSAGGGTEIDMPVHGNQFSTTFRIPSTYRGGGDSQQSFPVTPGAQYRFGAYPADLCDVPFEVTSSGPALAETGPTYPPLPLVSLAFSLILLGGWLTYRGRPQPHRSRSA